MNDTKNNQALFLTAPEVAERYKISKRQLSRLVQQGEMPTPLQFGNCQRWSLLALEEYESDRINESIAIFSVTSRPRKTRRK